MTAIAVAVAILGQSGFPNVGLENVVLTEKSAYFVLPPESIGTGQFVWMSWSPSGRHLVLCQAAPKLTPAIMATLLRGGQPPQPSFTLSVWDRTNSKMAVLGKLEEMPELHWLGKTDVALDLIDQEIPSGPSNPAPFTRTILLRVDAARQEMRLSTLQESSEGQGFMLIHASPTAPFAIIQETTWQRPDPGGRNQAFTRLYLADGSSRTAPLGDVGAAFVPSVTWVGSGEKARLVLDTLGPERKTETILVDAKGTKSPDDPNLKRWQPETRDLVVQMAPAQTSSGTVQQSHRAAWLRSIQPTEKSELLVAPRVDMAMASSGNEALAVLDGGVVTVRALMPIPAETYRELKETAEKTRALNDVKQVGIGALIFSADNDDRLPSASEVQSGVLDPYLKNNKLMEGFVYTFGGGDAAKLEAPAQTVLGYKAAAGGYAVVFADGHAKWLKELPKKP
jgi:hypothetical protein